MPDVTLLPCELHIIDDESSSGRGVEESFGPEVS